MQGLPPASPQQHRRPAARQRRRRRRPAALCPPCSGVRDLTSKCSEAEQDLRTSDGGSLFCKRCSSSMVPTHAPAAKLLVTTSSRSAALASQQRLWRPWQQRGRRPPCRTPAAPRAPAPAALPPLAAAAAPPAPAAARLCRVDSRYCAKQSLLRCPVSSSVQLEQCKQCAVRAV